MPPSPRRLPAAPPDTASLYVRLSQLAGAENLSLTGMLGDVERLAAREGQRVVATHVDDGLSGAIRNRPEFVAWLDDVRELRASTLIAFHVDRMTREGVNVAALILDAVEGKDPETGRVIREPARLIDTKGLDSAGDETSFRLRFVLAAEIARAERERMRERTRDMHRRAKAAGRWAGGPPPFGFRVVPNPGGPGKVLEADPLEEPALREMAERLLAGQSAPTVARWLNTHGPRPRRAAEWSRVTVRQALQTEAAARLVFGPAERRALAEALAVRAPDARKGGRHPARLLSGLLVCHACTTRLQVARRQDGSVTYRCPSRGEGRPCEAPVACSAPRVEEYVEALFLASFGRLPYVVHRAYVAGADALAEAQDAKDAALAALGRAPTAEAFAALQAAAAVLERLEAAPSETVVRTVATGRTVSEEWAREDVHGRREMLHDAYEDLILLPGRRGPRGFDGARLLPVLREGDPDPE